MEFAAKVGLKASTMSRFVEGSLVEQHFVPLSIVYTARLSSSSLAWLLSKRNWVPPVQVTSLMQQVDALRLDLITLGGC